MCRGYKAQAIVTADQCIVSAEITQQENDVHQLVPMLGAMEATLDAGGIEERPQALAADAGYWHDQLDVAQLEEAGPELFIATANRWREAQAQQQEGAPQGQMPVDTTPRKRMTRKVRTSEGQAAYRLRSQTVEPAFGQIKSIMGCRGVLRRGLEAVQSKWSLICACFNLARCTGRHMGMTKGEKKGESKRLKRLQMACGWFLEDINAIPSRLWLKKRGVGAHQTKNRSNGDE